MGVIAKLDYILGSFLCIFKVHNWGIFLGLLKFQIIFRVLEIPDIFGGMKGRCCARAYV